MKKVQMKLVEGEFTNLLDAPLFRPADAAGVYDAIKDRAVETAIVIYLRNDQTGFYAVHSVGSSMSTAVSTYNLFAVAQVHRATSYIFIHNHARSGTAKPSPSDLDVIQTLQAFSQRDPEYPSLQDFIIVGDDGDYWSYFDEQAGGEYTLGMTTDAAPN